MTMSFLRFTMMRPKYSIASLLVCVLFMWFGALLVFPFCNMRCEDNDLVSAQKHQFGKKKNVQAKKEMAAILVVLILSSLQNLERREAIRNTWLRNHPTDVLPRFVISIKNISNENSMALATEQSKCKDLLLLENINESYSMLTRKMLEAFSWIDQHVSYDYLFKADDDTFANINLLLGELKSKRQERLYWGFFDGRAHVHRRGKWLEKDWILCDRYLPYAVGGGYVLSEDLIHYIVSNKNFLKLFSSEDVSVGTWLGPLDINRIHDPRFDTEFISRGCNNAYIVTHKQSIVEMQEKFTNLQKFGKMCTKEVQKRSSYIYNWKVLPTKCCIRQHKSIP